MPHRRVLPNSRNNLFSVGARYGTEQRIETVNETILPTIDIEEPLEGHPGRSILAKFKYTRGYQPAHSFEIKWFRTQEDAEADTHRLTNPQIIPITQIIPHRPFTGGGDAKALAHTIFEGEVKFFLPTFFVYNPLYGVIYIYNDEAFGKSVINTAIRTGDNWRRA
ncbi:MAG: hypothetical protein OXM61_10665 [Candidatus Poribacteria bacterium]|nr:hypothetical protein [Candidatus Poribacteria bacterium]